MILLGEDTNENNIYNIDNNTKKVCLGFFGFFPYNRVEDVDDFIKKDLTLEELELYGQSPQLENFLNKKGCFLHYNMSGGGTNDLGYLINIEFDSKEKALEWFDNKIKGSDSVNKKLFTEIKCFDADKIISELSKTLKEKKQKSLLKKAHKQEMKKHDKIVRSALLDTIKELKITNPDSSKSIEKFEERIRKK